MIGNTLGVDSTAGREIPSKWLEAVIPFFVSIHRNTKRTNLDEFSNVLC